MITRRRFLQASGAAGAMLAWPIRALPFSQSVLQIKKFQVSLPGLGSGNANQLGNYIPVLTATPELIGGVTTDVYTINVEAFEQQMLPAPNDMKQRLWGYTAPGATPKYLGGVIVATGGKTPVPVQLKVTNLLPDKQIVPIDYSVIDPVVATQTGMRVDRVAIHLHGGFVFWAYDGGPFLWFSSNHPSFVKGSSCINAEDGIGTYNYPNAQSARTLWYHDHAYGLTRPNVYVGQASMYIITDNDADGEAGLISNGIIPGKGLTAATGLLGFPLIIQDKTFWDGPNGNDPTYGDPSVVQAGSSTGQLWYPHVYEGDVLANLPLMSLPADATQSSSPKARWELAPPPTQPLPAPSTVPEFFSDTLLVNGAPYPTLNVNPQRYRFRILNASQARFYNLQSYVADHTLDGYTLVQVAPTTNDDVNNLDNNGNVLLVPNNKPGPAFIQIANEAGFLPEPALFSTSSTANVNSNRIIRYKNASTVQTDRRRADGPDNVLLGDPTIGNVNQHNLLMAPAERADVLIDFRGFQGKSIILYSDAPAPFPGGDTRNDYFVNNPAVSGLAEGYNDLTALGGAPPPVTGNGPDTRVIMKFVVSNHPASHEPDFGDTVTALQSTSSGLPFVFAQTQPSQNLVPTVNVNKTLNEDADEFGRLRQLVGVVPLPAVSTFLDFPTEIALEGETQQWNIYNTTGDTHPMHFHLVNVKVIGRQQWAFNSDGTPKIPLTPIGPMVPPDDNEKGWREVVRMNPGEVTTVQMQFSLPTGTAPKNSPRLLASYGLNGAEYVWHCHILEHEEHDMMHALVVLPKGGNTAANTAKPDTTDKGQSSTAKGDGRTETSTERLTGK